MSFEIIVEIFTSVSLIATAIFPTIREYFLLKSSELHKDLRNTYLNLILQILIVMIYFNLIQIVMLLYIYYTYKKLLNPIYFGLSLVAVISSLIANIASLNIQISKYDFDVKFFDEKSVNNSLHGDFGIISFISRVFSIVIFLIFFSLFLVFLFLFSSKIRDVAHNYFKEISFQQFFGDVEIKTKKINESFEI